MQFSVFLPQSLKNTAFVGAIAIIFSACSPQSPEPAKDGMGVTAPVMGDRLVAEVDGTLITLMDIEREAAKQHLIERGEPVPKGSEAYERILEELIDQRLMALEAVRGGLQNDPEAQNRIRLARERILGNILVEQTINAAVTDAAVERLYKEQSKLAQTGEEVRARHILLQSREEAQEVRSALENGASFATLAFERSQDAATRLEGGDLGFFSRESMVGPFSDTAFSLQNGELSQPVETRYGWHIIKVESRRAAAQLALAEMRPQIVRFMTFDEIQKLISGLRENAVIVRKDQSAPAQADQAANKEGPDANKNQQTGQSNDEQ